jgi:dihydroorotase
MKSILIKNATLVNENQQYTSDVLIKNGRIERIARIIDTMADKEIDASGLYLIPGAIDDQVHFREPGLTHKGEIYTEAKAAVVGGVTSYMEMPNTVPGAVTIELLEEKYSRAAKCSLANYSFFMGTNNSNIDEVKRVNPHNICGVKIFMGSSTGDMLVDDPHELEAVFAESPTIIATHCEDDPMIKLNMANYKAQYGEDILLNFTDLFAAKRPVTNLLPTLLNWQKNTTHVCMYCISAQLKNYNSFATIFR